MARWTGSSASSWRTCATRPGPGSAQPADVRVPEAAERAADAGTPPGVGAVRVALLVGVRVMLRWSATQSSGEPWSASAPIVANTYSVSRWV